MSNTNNVEALTTILSVLKDLDSEGQKRTIQAVITFLGIPLSSSENEIATKSHAASHVHPDIQHGWCGPVERWRSSCEDSDILRKIQRVQSPA